MGKYTKEELSLIWLDSFIGLEYKHKKQLYKRIESAPSIKAFIEGSKEYIEKEIGENQYRTLLSSANQVYLDFILEGLVSRGISVLTIFSENYPKRLLETDLPPLVLYCIGDKALLNTQCISIVGSRRSLPSQISHAKNFTESIINAGFTIVTGIAEGVDSAVINSALDSNGKVISVVAGGFDNLYPASNKDLLNKVIKSGLAITENAPEVVPKPYHFPIRNRIIAGLSDATLIVSAGIKSGTMYTAEYAEDYGRYLFVIPYSIGVASGEGCNDLIKRGAMLVDKPQDVLDIFGKTEVNEKVVLDQQESSILQLLKEGSLHIEIISSKLNIPIFSLNATLSMLEIKGLVVKDGYNIYGLKR